MRHRVIRNAAFAGSFYPGEKQGLENMIDGFLSVVPKNLKGGKCRGLIVPHAGYVYSGQTQAYAYSALIPERVVLLGVNHSGSGGPLSLFGEGAWLVPNGRVECDDEFSEALAAKMPSLQTDASSHIREHSIEVQIPFLLRRNPLVKIVPISIYDYSVESAAELGKALSGTLKEFPGTLITASSDFTHCGQGYGQLPARGLSAAAWAEKQDALAEAKILSMDAEGLFETVRDNTISMCGLGPVMALIFALQDSSPEKLYYDTSSSVSGDEFSAVGYAAYALR
ncbi:MAG: AmmeMemoRadiSam system protein B [Elusimicrobia bacterium CG_4_10_14_3_um_filter_49_12_50_7]|nr:MAG: AmmeMemoRadiSam system protein B [Elusimicrobia bacterium CG03_land_8_20_14_0_80_50_18]PIY18052.1 MAG: AmmeMemoRadiSam system protein B [Elusimicrobia bacterium CG_4_10_14_3_um_filter_49_12_50_7]